MVHARDDARYAELLLGEQRDHEVVLVVTGRGDDDVARLQSGGAQRVDLARVRDHELHASSSWQTLCDVVALLDQQHLVSGAAQVVGDEEADVAGTGDRDPHQ